MGSVEWDSKVYCHKILNLCKLVPIFRQQFGNICVFMCAHVCVQKNLSQTIKYNWEMGFAMFFKIIFVISYIV